MFKELAALLTPGADLVVTITCPSAGQLTLCILRKNFKDSLPPLVVTAPAEELDTNFSELVVKPLETTATALSNSEQYEKMAKKMEEERRAKLTAPKPAKKTAAAAQPSTAKPPVPAAGAAKGSPDGEDEENADGSQTPSPNANDNDAQLGLFAATH